MEFEDKNAALTGAFVNRFSIGFVIGAADLPLASWINGLLFGLLLSLPDAIITKAWAPIMGMGAVGGIVIGLVVGKWGV
jgi:sorbitol-specific phosphotransferase system component IIBC